MKNLFVCNTYLQLIIAVMLKKEFLANDYADLILTDHTNGLSVVGERLKLEKVFNNVYFVESKILFDEKHRLHYHYHIIKLLFNRTKNVEKYLKEKGIQLDYDNFYYYNNNVLNWFIWDILKKNNNLSEQIMFEEGVLGYNKWLFTPPIHREFKQLSAIRSFFHKPFLQDNVNTYYCLYPEIIQGKNKYKCRKISPLNDNLTIELLARIFDYDQLENPINEKYIYFCGSEDIDGIGVNEDQIVSAVADIVGRENLIVKMHPRDTRDIYEKLGIKVFKGKSVPWEIMAIVNNYSEKVFLTISSSSIITGNVFKNESVNAFYLYPLVSKGRPDYIKRIEDLGIESILFSLQKFGICKNYEIISSKEALQVTLKCYDINN